jgi:hypothetical protein
MKCMVMPWKIHTWIASLVIHLVTVEKKISVGNQWQVDYRVVKNVQTKILGVKGLQDPFQICCKSDKASHNQN